jgi:hypothetical protein
MLCVFWMTKVSPLVKLAGGVPVPLRAVFQLANSWGGRLPRE